MDSGRCCCGRIKEGLEPGERTRINDRVHARLGDEGAFCGTWWQHEIQDDEIRRGLLDLVERLLAVLRRVHKIRIGLELRSDQLQDGGVVVDDQY